MLGKNSKLGRKTTKKNSAKKGNVEASKEVKTCKNCSSKTGACTRSCTKNCK